MTQVRIGSLQAGLIGVFFGVCSIGAFAQSEVEPAKPSTVWEIRAQSELLAPLVVSDAARSFLRASATLPEIETRVVYRDRARGLAITEVEFERLDEEERDGFERNEYDERFYYYTGYGTPLTYARALDVAAAAGIESFEGKRIFDFGYGAIGHLRMLGSLGAETVGVEVQALFQALYSFADDQGEISHEGGAPGCVTLVHGNYPGDEDVRTKVGDGFDLIVSKNVLKRGYIHPERSVDERMMIKLGVSDEVFVQELFDALNPGGLVMIYNISPKMATADEPYVPWADGRCPFDRALLEGVGFEVIAYNTEDSKAIHNYWMTLELNRGMTRDEVEENIFAKYTLFRRPAVDDR